MNGGWFWWGASPKVNNTADDFKHLYQYVVTYLRDMQGVHNVLYAYSPGKFTSQLEYLRFYPGDDFVDIFGLDYYYDTPSSPSIHDFQTMIRVMGEVANSRNKPAAITEIGLKNSGINTHHNFFSDRVLTPLKNSQGVSKVAYMLTWFNYCSNGSTCKLWVPYKGHPAADAFMRFYHNPVTVFRNGIAHVHPQFIG